MSRLRTLARLVASTPLHPQWLMGQRVVPEPLRTGSGILLDIGSADRWLQQTLDQGASYVAFDYPVTACSLYGTQPDVFGNASQLPFADDSIDMVACFEVLEHVRDPEAVLSEIARVLRPGGLAALSMPFLYPVHDAPHDYQRWTIHGWQRSATNCGLTVEEAGGAGHALHAAGVLTCLAIAGPLQHASGLALAWRLPLAALVIPIVNVTVWGLALLWPDWDALATGHRMLLRKP